jgi:hypothetical protein
MVPMAVVLRQRLWSSRGRSLVAEAHEKSSCNNPNSMFLECV